MFMFSVFLRGLLLGGLISFCWAWHVPTNALAAEAPAYLAWGERDAVGTYRMHFSRYDGASWSFPVLLSEGVHDEILPTVGSDPQGRIWVAWAELQGIHGVIRYRVFSNGEWGAPETLTTATSSDLAPWLAVDPEGRAWMVFSGSDGIQDDVYAVHWLGDGWSVPEKVHPDNQTPDILPRIAIAADDHPVVTWQGFDGTRYQTVSSKRDDDGWSFVKSGVRAPRAADADGLHAGLRDHCDALPPLPDFVGDVSQAVLHVRFDEVETIRLGEDGPCR